VTTNGDPGDRVGLIDTNIFFHAQTHDAHSEECSRFVEALERGDIQAILDPIVLHELSFVLPLCQADEPTDVATYLLVVLSWPGVLGDKDTMADAVQLGCHTWPLLADAYLAAVPQLRTVGVHQDIRHLRGQSVDVPDPLPDGR
jgi:predicted nucleic acid-binding protein